jgi:hypothetical protein
MNLKNVLGSILLLGAGVGAQDVDVVAEFTFDGNSAASSDVSSYSTVSDWDLTYASASATITGEMTVVLADGNNENGGTTVNSLDPTVSGTVYQSFTLTVTGLGAGGTLSLSSLTFDYIVVSPLGFSCGVYSSLSGFTGTGDSLGGQSAISTAGTYPVSIDLTTNPVFAGLENGDTVEFRIYLADGSSNVSTRKHELDNIVLSGSVSSRIHVGLFVVTGSGS